MSLVNQVLKDLEQRHASQAQAEELGIEDLRYVPTGQASPKRSYKWAIFASLLIALGVMTAAGTYVFHESDAAQAPEQVAAPASITPLLPHITQPKAKPAANVAAQQVKQNPQPTQTKPQAAVQTASMSTKPSVVVKKTKAKLRVDDESPGTMQKSIVPLRNEQRAELAYQEGHHYITVRRYRNAETALRSALALEPAHIKAREMLAGVYISQGRWVEASELLRNGLVMAPQHHVFTKLYARTLMQLKRDEQAIEVLSASQPVVAQDPEHYAILAALYQRQSNHDAATRAYSEILKVHPHMGIWWVGMAISLEALGEYQQAVAAYQQARKSGTLNGDVARYTDNRLMALDAIDYPIN